MCFAKKIIFKQKEFTLLRPELMQEVLMSYHKFAWAKLGQGSFRDEVYHRRLIC